MKNADEPWTLLFYTRRRGTIFGKLSTGASSLRYLHSGPLDNTPEVLFTSSPPPFFIFTPNLFLLPHEPVPLRPPSYSIRTIQPIPSKHPIHPPSFLHSLTFPTLQCLRSLRHAEAFRASPRPHPLPRRVIRWRRIVPRKSLIPSSHQSTQAPPT